jgi:pyruvate formate lyase activating enzyme
MPPARYYQTLENGRLRCLLCPHYCLLQEGQTGRCLVRRAGADGMELPYAGGISALALDPIEKKPLYHFLPGTQTFSVGYMGCNLHCPFCQNFHISRELTVQPRYMSPVKLIAAALESGCPSISHTYSEPLVHAEYVAACLQLARQSGLRNILVTNGCVNETVALDLLPLVDAVNVDLKSWRADWYGSELGGHLASVKSFISLAYNLKVHVEVSTLIIPDRTDDPDEIVAMAKWLAGLSVDIPFHLSAYRPMYKYHLPAPQRETLQALVDLASGHLQNVYAGNLASCH